MRACLTVPAMVVSPSLGPHTRALEPLGLPIHEMTVPLAEVAARIAARRPELAGPPHALRPLYVRKPDAVLARERAGLAGIESSADGRPDESDPGGGRAPKGRP